MVEKTSTDGGLQTSAGESQTSAGGVDLPKIHLKETLSAFPTGERERSHSLAVIPGALVPDGGAPKDFKVLWSRWSSVRPWPDTDQHKADACRAYVIVRREAEPDEIYSRAEAMIAAIDDPKHLPKLADWLSNDNWRKPPPQRNQTRSKRYEPTPGEILLNRYRGGS